MKRALALACALAVTGMPAAAQCRQALALALDVSGSVNAREYRQQVEGVAMALSAPRVRQLILSVPAAPVHVIVYEWSGPGDHRVIAPWSVLQSQADIDTFAETLRQVVRRDATPGTALGDAMQVGLGFLQTQNCWRRTLDISGDGKSNLGPRPRDVRDAIAASGITINGLVIGADTTNGGDIRQAEIGELSAYYKAEVILGPDAFVQTAIGFEDYARAMTEKLLRELEGVMISHYDPAPASLPPQDQ